MSGTSIIVNTQMAHDAKIFQDCKVRNCILGEGASVGDYSRIDNSQLSAHCAIQRNNMIYHSSIGDYTYTGKNCSIWYASIGKYCSISWNVSIGGANHDYRRITTHSFLYSNDFGLKPENENGYNRFTEICSIGNDVWIAANACICRSVKVGNGAVIAAGAVVTKDVAPYSIVAGVPAQEIKKRFDESIIELLNQSRWWDLPSKVIKENYHLFNQIADIETAEKIEALCKEYLRKN